MFGRRRQFCNCLQDLLLVVRSFGKAMSEIIQSPKEILPLGTSLEYTITSELGQTLGRGCQAFALLAENVVHGSPDSFGFVQAW